MFNQKEYNKKYRTENKEKVKQIQDDYYEKHRDERIKNSKMWYAKNHNVALETRRLRMMTPQGRLKSIKSSAKTRDIEYCLTDEEALSILILPCFYCDNTLKIGIDRIDSSKGYTKINSVACCSMCNYMKKDFNQLDFINQCKLIVKKHS